MPVTNASWQLPDDSQMDNGLLLKLYPPHIAIPVIKCSCNPVQPAMSHHHFSCLASYPSLLQAIPHCRLYCPFLLKRSSPQARHFSDTHTHTHTCSLDHFCYFLHVWLHSRASLVPFPCCCYNPVHGYWPATCSWMIHLLKIMTADSATYGSVATVVCPLPPPPCGWGLHMRLVLPSVTRHFSVWAWPWSYCPAIELFVSAISYCHNQWLWTFSSSFVCYMFIACI